MSDRAPLVASQAIGRLLYSYVRRILDTVRNKNVKAYLAFVSTNHTVQKP